MPVDDDPEPRTGLTRDPLSVPVLDRFLSDSSVSRRDAEDLETSLAARLVELLRVRGAEGMLGSMVPHVYDLTYRRSLKVDLAGRKLSAVLLGAAVAAERFERDGGVWFRLPGSAPSAFPGLSLRGSSVPPRDAELDAEDLDASLTTRLVELLRARGAEGILGSMVPDEYDLAYRGRSLKADLRGRKLSAVLLGTAVAAERFERDGGVWFRLRVPAASFSLVPRRVVARLLRLPACCRA